MLGDDDGYVDCTCGCGQRVKRQTQWNHTHLVKATPLAKAASISYRRQILEGVGRGEELPPLRDLMSSTLEDVDMEPPAEALATAASAPSLHACGSGNSPGPAMGDGEHMDEFEESTEDAVLHALRRMTCNHAPLAESNSGSDSEEEDDGLLLSDPGDEEIAEEMDELDEDGLYAYQRLNEKYVRELADLDLLSSEDKAILRSYSFRVQTSLTERDFKKIPYAYPSDVPPLSGDATDSRAAFLSGLDPRLYDCCPKSCVCYTGPYAALQECPTCGTSRYNAYGRPRKVFTYIPLTPRLEALCANPEMAQKMQYRAEYNTSPARHTTITSRCERIHALTGNGSPSKCYCPSKVDDVFDGSHYRALRDTPVVVNDKPQPHNHFADQRDIALGLSTDGFGPFKRRSQTCWPLLVYNYNLPPEERFHKENLICVGVIPGPKKPKDFDSFLWPLAEEMLHLALGTDALDALSQKKFLMRAFIILCGGDIPAISMVMRMKGHNGYCPCRACKILGVQVPNGTSNTYYVPLDRSRHPGVRDNPSAVPKYDPLNLPLRTHAEFIEQAREVEGCRTNAARDRLSREYGIKGVPVLSCLSSLAFPVSFPYDLMHIIFENVMKNLVELWTGDHKGLSEGREEYQLENSVWKAVGLATSAACDTIPSAYSPRVGNIADPTERGHYSADMWSFWMSYLGPSLLLRKFKQRKYHDHFVELVRLLTLCLRFELHAEQIDEVRTGLKDWVEKFERFYYQYDPARVAVCVLTVHALLHFADSIEFIGPLWAYWAFPMERFCGIVQRHVKSRRFPFASIDTFVVGTARLSHLGVRYNIAQELRLEEPPGAPVRGQRTVPGSEYEPYILLPPHVPRGFVQDPALLRRVTVHLCTRYGMGMKAARKYAVPENIELYGKLRAYGDTISASELVRVSDDRRDASWVRFEALVDRNARRPHAREDLELTTFYGQLQNIIVLHLPDARELHRDERGPKTLVLADIYSCNTDIEGPLDVRMFEDMLAKLVHDVTTVQCLVGRFKLARAASKPIWAIVDRSGYLGGAQWAEEDEA